MFKKNRRKAVPVDINPAARYEKISVNYRFNNVACSRCSRAEQQQPHAA